MNKRNFTGVNSLLLFLVIFLNWSLVFFGTEINPSHDILTTTSPKFVSSNLHQQPSDEQPNNIARSRSTNFHNPFHTRHREKNRKNNPPQSHYYIKQHYYPYNPSTSSHITSLNDDPYPLESSNTIRIHSSFLLIFLAMLYHI